MFVKEMPLEPTLEIIRTARPASSPNQAFLKQLAIFQETSYRLSRWNKSTRMFYLDRAAREVMNGDGSDLPLHMLAKFPRSPGDSGPVTPGAPKRRIRCRLCRQELATQEHLMHIVNSTQNTPITSRRTSFGEYFPVSPQSRRNSSSTPGDLKGSNPVFTNSAVDDAGVPNQLSSLFLSLGIRRDSNSSPIPVACAPSNASSDPLLSNDYPRRAEVTHSTSALESDEEGVCVQLRGSRSTARQTKLPPQRRSSNLMMTPIKPKDPGADQNRLQSPPIMANVTCSGYFLEPMKWMESSLATGTVSGKIVCPNEKCGVKLGNFDWAGMMCSCREWVTPGFCIARSKVDEVI